MKKKFIIRTFDGLGDVIMSLPSARYLYQEQGYEVHYICKHDYISLFNHIPYVKTINIETNANVDLTNKLSKYEFAYNRQDRIDATAHLINIKLPDRYKKPIIPIANNEINNIFQKFKKIINFSKPIIVLAPFSIPKERTYPIINIQKLIKYLHNITPNIILTHHRRIEIPHCINLTARLALRELLALVYISDLVISTDTGTYHIAGSYDKPLIGLFGPINKHWRGQYYKNKINLQSKLSCCPCNDRGHLKRKYGCSKYMARCMLAITPESIYEHAIKMLK